MTRLAAETAAETAHVVLHEVLVTGLEVEADIGVYAHEMGVRQKLLIDVVLETRPPRHDTLPETLDYGLIVSYALALAEERNALIETFARRLCELCLQHPQVDGVEVRIGKPSALPQALAGTRIRMRKNPA